MSYRNLDMEQDFLTKRMIMLRNFAKSLWKHKMLLLLLTPVLAYFIIFKYIPMYGVTIAFKNFNFRRGILGSDWIGFAHFARMFNTFSFREVLRNTVVISFSKILFGFPAPIIFAILLNEIKHRKFKRTVQTISYLPNFLSWVVIAGIMRALLSFNGPVNALVNMFGGTSKLYLTEPGLFVPILIISDMWRNVGWGSILYLAAITGIDSQLYEASKIDGAGRIKQCIYITIPSLTPVISILFLMRIGHILNAGFDQVLNLYNPLVYSVADIIDTYTYRVGLVEMQFSYSTAVGLFKNVIGVILMLVVNKTVGKVKQYGII